MFRWNPMLRPLFGSNSKQRRVRNSKVTVRLYLETLEDRTLLSGSPGNPLPVFSVASPPPAPPVAAILTYMSERVNQWYHLVETVQQDVIGAWKALG